MRILKYIFLLFFLILIGLTVFVATQKPNYDVTRAKVIKNPKSVVYAYINDYRNWETFASWIKNDESIKFNYPELTIGKGASCSWKSDSNEGTMKTTFAKENDSIAQIMIQNDEQSTIYWKFKDTVGGTKVTWRSKGKLDFKSKVLAFFQGGVNSVVGDVYERSLENLNKTLDYEINTFKIKINGIVYRPGGFYLKQFIHCNQKEVDKNIKSLVPRMQHFFEKNNIIANGKPFILYHKYDRANDYVAFSVGMPIRDSINIMPGSDIESKELTPYTCLKITLIGDYSHTQAAWKKGLDYIAKNKLERNTTGQIIEVYVKGRGDVKNPSQWITEIYIPVYPKAVPKRTYKKPTDSTTVVIPETVPETPNP
ncbi:GyrI-like domain-containing protein [Flavobacterium sp. SUN052]|uniref:SRPBCC family protein n=1 Tax=Flavobacterium sp. SUN052 TaxID=3002441 RepID=UPI00237E43BC|nr:GyrI-like domain-containing protein [Flavobacterium sp. SUN052]MEC4005654.1 GyrI-like domain-containing protein [Flavobacterium sp. SUN052]